MNSAFGRDYPGSTAGAASKIGTQKVRVAIYARVSSDLQLENWSLTSQITEGTDYCERTPGFSVTKEYVERGHSAWKGNANTRPVYLQMMQDAKAGRFDVLLTTSVDRMSRNVVNLLDTVRQLREYGVTYVSIHENLDFSGPMGEFMLTQLGAFAQMQSSILSAHTTRGREERLRQGLYTSRPPYGYQVCDDSCPATEGHVGCHINEEKAEVVRKVFRLYAGGQYSMKDIADLLNAEGHRTNGKFADRVGVERPGNRWTAGAISQLLKNRFYLGQLKYQGMDLPGIHEPIMSEEEFDRVQAVADRNARKYMFDGRRAEHDHMLSRLVECNDCGRRLHAEARETAGGNFKTSYKHPSIAIGEPCEHEGRSVRGREIEEVVEQYFEGFELRPDWRDYIYTNFANSINYEELKQREKTLIARRRKLRQEYYQGKMEDEEYAELMATIDASLDAIEVPGKEVVEEAAQKLADFRQLWASMNTKERNKLLLSTLDAVHVDMKEGRFVSLLPRPEMAGPIRAMKDRTDLSVSEAEKCPEGVELKGLGMLAKGLPSVNDLDISERVVLS